MGEWFLSTRMSSAPVSGLRIALPFPHSRADAKRAADDGAAVQRELKSNSIPALVEPHYAREQVPDQCARDCGNGLPVQEAMKSKECGGWYDERDAYELDASNPNATFELSTIPKHRDEGERNRERN